MTSSSSLYSNIKSIFATLFNIRHNYYCTTLSNNKPKALYKYLLKQCMRLPNGPREHYKFMIKQSFKQHVNETDPERIQQIIKRSYEDCDWILKKENIRSMLDKIPLATSSTSISPSQFWRTVWLYHDRPHLVNRKLAAITQVLCCEILSSDGDAIVTVADAKQIKESFTLHAIRYELRRRQDKLSVEGDGIKDVVMNLIENIVADGVVLQRSVDQIKDNNSTCGVYVSFRYLWPRRHNTDNNNNAKNVEVVILDKTSNLATFIAVKDGENAIGVAPAFPYEIELSTADNLRIILNNFEDADTASAQWLADKVFDKLLKWTAEQDNGTAGATGELSSIQSLSLVPADRYCRVYGRLKQTYGPNLVQQWPASANTDPQKYVFEDVAIAAYLICLWTNYSKNQIDFVDCGCGNGLLVYILTREGYRGRGIDVRKRKTWDCFTDEVADLSLTVDTVVPSSRFSQATWILGNHSDELTPWIPVIAARSSQQTNFFLLPCCPYDFNGRKYIRTDSTLSQYADYLNYIRRISVKCGFRTDIDKLRIPSTKRICLVGIRVQMANGDDFAAQKYLSDNSQQTIVMRSPIEPVRNCTQLNRSLVNRIVEFVVARILAKNCGDSSGTWNRGGSISLSELCREIVPPDDLKLLKNECGGLQTLLRNHRYIFKIDRGVVTLRVPPSVDEEPTKYRSKPCWFLKNHPNGCLHEAQTCAYQHV